MPRAVQEAILEHLLGCWVLHPDQGCDLISIPVSGEGGNTLMKKWIPLLTLSLAIGAGLAWIARPLELSVRWGERPEQTASLSIGESTAAAERTPEDQRAIDSVESTSRAFVANASTAAV